MTKQLLTDGSRRYVDLGTALQIGPFPAPLGLPEPEFVDTYYATALGIAIVRHRVPNPLYVPEVVSPPEIFTYAMPAARWELVIPTFTPRVLAPAPESVPDLDPTLEIR